MATETSRFADKIREIFKIGWKNNHLAPAVSASVIQKILNQGYLPTERKIGKMAAAIIKEGVSVDLDELLTLRRQQKAALAAVREKINVPSKWDQYLCNVPEAKHALSSYLKRYSDRNGQEQFRGMRKPLPLKDCYINLQMIDPGFLHEWKTVGIWEKEYRGGNLRSFLPKSMKRSDALELANKTQYLNVLGELGAGKSTFLRRIGLEALLSNWERKYDHDCIPVFVELKRIKEQPVRLNEIIRKEMTSYGFPEGFADVALKEGKLLILLDGIDESSTEQLEQLREDIGILINEQSTNRFITSCRPSFYQRWLTRFTDVVVADFDNRQIASFLRNWFCSPPDNNPEIAKNFSLSFIWLQNAATFELVRRPLLLSYFCFFFDEKLSPLENRRRLFEGTLSYLIQRTGADDRIRYLTQQWETIMLEQIAGRAFVDDRLFFSKRKLVGEIDRFLQKNLNAPDMNGQAVLEAIEVHQGLLVTRAHNVYSFFHRTFQEYLAAKYCYHAEQPNDLVAQNFLNPQWRNVFLFLVGMGPADNWLIQMAKTTIESIKENKIIRSMLTWVAKSHKSGRIGEQCEEELLIRRACVLEIAASFGREEHRHRSDGKYFVTDDGVVQALDPSRHQQIYGSLFWTFTEKKRALTQNISRDTALDVISLIRKHNILNDDLLDTAIDKIEPLKFPVKTKPQKSFTKTRWPFGALVKESSELRDAFRMAFKIPGEMADWTMAEEETWEAYLYGCNFLIECKKAALSVDANVWKDILNSLILVRDAE